jgi:predicted transglutaminase-like cysteine proteinase
VLGAVTDAPKGWLQFCAENPDDCRASVEAPREVVLTPTLLQQLFSSNSFANSRVKWTSDVELYGRTEHWAYALGRGDCEDIVLLKRRLLTKAGWPLSALLITVVEDPSANNGRHAILTIRTDHGEFILDNQTPEVLFWHELSLPDAAKRDGPEGLACVSRPAAQARKSALMLRKCRAILLCPAR